MYASRPGGSRTSPTARLPTLSTPRVADSTADLTRQKTRRDYSPVVCEGSLTLSDAPIQCFRLVRSYQAFRSGGRLKPSTPA
jgi:hypothetical protein